MHFYRALNNPALKLRFKAGLNLYIKFFYFNFIAVSLIPFSNSFDSDSQGTTIFEDKK